MKNISCIFLQILYDLFYCCIFSCVCLVTVFIFIQIYTKYVKCSPNTLKSTYITMLNIHCTSKKALVLLPKEFFYLKVMSFNVWSPFTFPFSMHQSVPGICQAWNNKEIFSGSTSEMTSFSFTGIGKQVPWFPENLQAKYVCRIKSTPSAQADSCEPMTHKRFHLISKVKDVTLGYQTST